MLKNGSRGKQNNSRVVSGGTTSSPTHTVMNKGNIMAKWAELSEDKQAVLVEEAEKILTPYLYCTRTWEAWQAGTMTESDFEKASEDGGAEDVARCIFDLLQKYSSNNLI